MDGSIYANLFSGLGKAVVGAVAVAAVVGILIGGAVIGGVSYFRSRENPLQVVENAALDRVDDLGYHPRSARCQPLTQRAYLCTVLHRQNPSPMELTCTPRGGGRPGYTCDQSILRIPQD